VRIFILVEEAQIRDVCVKPEFRHIPYSAPFICRTKARSISPCCSRARETRVFFAMSSNPSAGRLQQRGYRWSTPAQSLQTVFHVF
jgi:hypothetical protein